MKIVRGKYFYLANLVGTYDEGAVRNIRSFVEIIAAANENEAMGIAVNGFKNLYGEEYTIGLAKVYPITEGDIPQNIGWDKDGRLHTIETD